DEVRLARSKQVGQSGVVVGALLTAPSEVQRLDAGGARSLEAAGRAAIADDRDDSRTELPGLRGVDQGLQVASFAGDQHGDARSGACHDKALGEALGVGGYNKGQSV